MDSTLNSPSPRRNPHAGGSTRSEMWNAVTGGDGRVRDDWKDALVARVGELYDDGERSPLRDAVAFEECFDTVTDICWAAREQGRGDHREELARPGRAGERSTTAYLVRALIELQLCRFDFDYEGIRRVLHFADDAPLRTSSADLNLVFSTFASLAAGTKVSGKTILNAVGVPMEGKSDQQIIADLSPVPVKIKHLLLHGMWLFPNNSYGHEMLLLAASILSGAPREANAYYRLGEAYRRLANTFGDTLGVDADAFEDPLSGRRLYSADDFYAEAIAALDSAMQVADPADTYHHSEFKNYRVLVSSERQVNASIRSSLDREVREVKELIDAMSEDLENQSKEWLFRVVEILSIFVAIIGILIANITLISGEQLSGDERIQLILAMSAVFVVFFVVIHLSLRGRTWARKSRSMAVREQVERREERKRRSRMDDVVADQERRIRSLEKMVERQARTVAGETDETGRRGDLS